MRKSTIPSSSEVRTPAVVLSVCLLCACRAEGLLAQAPCPDFEVVATGLLGPSKVIQNRRGNFLIAESGPEEPNNGRVSIVDRHGERRTLLDGLPSARTFVGDFNGTTGLCLRGRTLFVLNGQGDVTLRGPVPGTEIGNPTPASPIFSSVLAVHFSAATEETTTGVRLTVADHEALKEGESLSLADENGRIVTIELVADFVDYLSDPRPSFPGNVRHSHPYGIEERDQVLYIVDAGFNRVRTVDLVSGAEGTLAVFPPTPNPLPVGPPLIENVPTSIHWAGETLLVTLLSGAPAFLPGYSQVQQVDPRTGVTTPLITGLSSAVDVIPVGCHDESGGFLTLEFDLNFPAPGPGRMQFYPSADATPLVVTDCLTTPTSMAFDRREARVVVTEQATGRLVGAPRQP